MRHGSHSLGEFPSKVVRIDCERCGRTGSYRLDGLVARFGVDAALPDVLTALASCEQTSLGRRHRLALLCGEAVKRGTFCLRRRLEPAVGRFFQLSRCFAAVSLAAVPVASSPSSAHILVVRGCEAAEQLTDGSWHIRSTRTFGPVGEVDAGAIIWRGTIINSVDLGAFLEKRCFSRYNVEPDYPPYIWPPNGYSSWVTPIP
jgi:hypothetical protein